MPLVLPTRHNRNKSQMATLNSIETMAMNPFIQLTTLQDLPTLNCFGTIKNSFMFETYTLEDRPEQINGLGWRQTRNETFKAEKSDWSNKKKL